MFERDHRFLPQQYSRYTKTNEWLDHLLLTTHGPGYLARGPKSEIRLAQEAIIPRMTNFLKFLDNPQDKYKAIHVTGTSGKGSVSTLISALLQKNISSVGLHTKPYTQIPLEKLIINGKMIKPFEYVDYVESMRKLYNLYVSTNPNDVVNHAEVWTALTHFVFANQNVDWGVFEVGMGGRFDASNVINTRVSVINNVDFDHLALIGPSLEDIAWHKAGIIKPNMPTVTAVTQKEVLEVIKKEALSKNSKLYVIDKDFQVGNIRTHKRGVTADLFTPFGQYYNVYIDLSGDYQAINAVTALTAAQIALSEEGAPQLTENQIRESFSSIHFPGRFEVMQESPLVVLDGAHNPAKMLALTHLLNSNFVEMDITLVIGMLKTKDALTSLKHIIPFINKAIATEVEVIGKTTLSANEMAVLLHQLNPNIEISECPHIDEAIKQAVSGISDPSKEMVVATGSIYSLKQARELWFPTQELIYELEYGK